MKRKKYQNILDKKIRKIISLFVKATAQYSQLSILHSGSAGVFNGGESIFNASNGTFISVAASTTSTVENFPNGWYRLTLTQASQATANGLIIIRSYNGSTTFFAGNGTDGIYIWGAQIEGSYATSYIPNHSGTGTITRAKDYAYFDSASSIIGQNEGTIYFNGKDTSKESQFLLINRSTTNSFCIYSAGNQVRFFVFNNTVVHSYNTGISSIDEFKAVIKYDNSAVKYFINGSLVQTYAAWDLAIPLVDLRLNDSAYITDPGKSKVEQVLLFNTALSDADCITLTTI